eukprot:s768_g20.t1
MALATGAVGALGARDCEAWPGLEPQAQVGVLSPSHPRVQSTGAMSSLHLHGKEEAHSSGVTPLGGSTSSTPWGAMPWPFGGAAAHRSPNSFQHYSRSQVMVCKDERYEVSFLENEGPTSLARSKLLGALEICILAMKDLGGLKVHVF